MLLGYHTNSLADHPLAAAIELVADLGYQCIAITLNHHALDPFGDNLSQHIEAARRLLEQHQLACVIETGARYLLDRRRRHQPTLLSPTDQERQVRIDLLKRAIDIAQALDARCVSFWSGATVDEAPREESLSRLRASLQQVVEHARAKQVALAFEPEPGHAIDTMQSFEQLLEFLPEDVASDLRLTIDIGHLHCLGEVPIRDQLVHWGDLLENVHIDDMRQGVHEHLPLGQGEIDFPPVVQALEAIGYQGPVTVELPRQSHVGPEVAQQSIEFLREAMHRR